jgi:hypothetical protein
LLKGHTAEAAAKHSDNPIEVQSLDGVINRQQLWFHPLNNKGWVEVAFESRTNQIAELTISTVHSYDYGIYRVLLDGKQIAQLDLYDPEIVPTADKLRDPKTRSRNPYLAL